MLAAEEIKDFFAYDSFLVVSTPPPQNLKIAKKGKSADGCVLQAGRTKQKGKSLAKIFGGIRQG